MENKKKRVIAQKIENTVHSALNAFTQNEDYHIQKAFVVSNAREITTKGKITYLPIYYIMFFSPDSGHVQTVQYIAAITV